MPKKDEHHLIDLTSDAVHNKNCFNYLKELVFSPALLQLILQTNPGLADFFQNLNNYIPDYAYGDKYRKFFTYVERHFDTLFSSKVPQQELDNWVISIYHNDNFILEETFEVIKNIVQAQKPGFSGLKKLIIEKVEDKKIKINTDSLSPAQLGSVKELIKAVTTSDFKPQHGTNLSTVRHYAANKNSPVIEYRFGTQGQRHQGLERVDPLFEKFIEAQGRNTTGITHIYFNNLGKDRDGVADLSGKKEKRLTEKLHDLESKYSNVAVITLPANKGLMNRHAYKNVNPKYHYQHVFKEFLQIATEDSSLDRDVKDFYISPKIRGLLFKNKEHEIIQLSQLLDNSFEALGIKKTEKFSKAQRQAVWFHFNKFELPNYIISVLKPKSINFTCKDAIDRGGVSSAYYNLIKSFTSSIPMTCDELNCALYAAPTMVKGRGINHQINIIWNAINFYVNYKNLNTDQTWLIEWRDSHCPHERIPEILKLRVNQGIKQLNAYAKEHPSAKGAVEKGLIILQKIKEQSDLNVSGKRMLLESVNMTINMISKPHTVLKIDYQNLINKLDKKSNYPQFKMIGGLLKILIGLILYVPTFGKTRSLISKGHATFSSGLNAKSRKELAEKMKEQLMDSTVEQSASTSLFDKK